MDVPAKKLEWSGHEGRAFVDVRFDYSRYGIRTPLDSRSRYSGARHARNTSIPDATLYQILQVLSVTLFEKTPILRAFDDQGSQEKSAEFSNQLNLLDF